MYEAEVAKLQKIIDESQNIVFFGGAGVSTESKIPDFRSADGLYLSLIHIYIAFSYSSSRDTRLWL